MKKIITKIKSNIEIVIGIIIGGVVFGTLGVYAATVLASSQVSYTKNSQKTVEGALDELYTRANNQLPKMSDMCPGCVFTYTTSTWYLASNSSATVLTDAQISSFKTNWEDVVVANSKKNFLGLIINSSTKKIDRAFACSINNGVPFCIEGVQSTNPRVEEVYAANKALLQSKALYNRGCDDYGSSVYCSGSVYAFATSNGGAPAGGASDYCDVNSDGSVHCY